MTEKEAIDILNPKNTVQAVLGTDDKEKCIGAVNEACVVAIQALEKQMQCNECSRRKWYQKGYYDAKNESKWIPCSERLPEERDWYLAVFKEVDTGYVLIPRVADYMKGHTNEYLTSDGWMIIDSDTESNGKEYFNLLECIAWMPLPEPYKGGE